MARWLEDLARHRVVAARRPSAFAEYVDAHRPLRRGAEPAAAGPPRLRGGPPPLPRVPVRRPGRARAAARSGARSAPRPARAPLPPGRPHARPGARAVADLDLRARRAVLPRPGRPGRARPRPSLPARGGRRTWARGRRPVVDELALSWRCSTGRGARARRDARGAPRGTRRASTPPPHARDSLATMDLAHAEPAGWARASWSRWRAAWTRCVWRRLDTSAARATARAWRGADGIDRVQQRHVGDPALGAVLRPEAEEHDATASQRHLHQRRLAVEPLVAEEPSGEQRVLLADSARGRCRPTRRRKPGCSSNQIAARCRRGRGPADGAIDVDAEDAPPGSRRSVSRPRLRAAALPSRPGRCTAPATSRTGRPNSRMAQARTRSRER